MTLALSSCAQKAVCIHLTLLSPGIRNLYIGPSVPAFFSSTVVNVPVFGFRRYETAEGKEGVS